MLLLPVRASSQNLLDAIGCWNMLHSMDITKSGVSLQLYRNGNFTFKDYNDMSRDYELLRGSWELRGPNIVLKVKDRPLQETFTMRRDERAGRWLLVKAGGFELQKEDPEDCR